MADIKISALTAAAAAAAANEFAINEAGTSKKVSGAQIQTLTWNAPLFAGGSASAGTKPRLQAGALLSTQETGAIEFNDGIPYFTPTVGARGIIGIRQPSILTADFTLLNQTAVQSAFPTGQDVFTVEANRLYWIDGQYFVTTGTTSAALRIAWLLTTATLTYMKVYTNGVPILANDSSAAANVAGWMDGVAVTTVVGNSAIAGKACEFKGYMAFGTGGTITPQVAFTAAPGGTNLMKTGSNHSFTVMGSNTMTQSGNWA